VVALQTPWDQRQQHHRDPVRAAGEHQRRATIKLGERVLCALGRVDPKKPRRPARDPAQAAGDLVELALPAAADAWPPARS